LDIEECVTINTVIAAARRRRLRLGLTRNGSVQVSLKRSYEAKTAGLGRE
jgi:hypothetical protein